MNDSIINLFLLQKLNVSHSLRKCLNLLFQGSVPFMFPWTNTQGTVERKLQRHREKCSLTPFDQNNTSWYKDTKSHLTFWLHWIHSGSHRFFHQNHRLACRQMDILYFQLGSCCWFFQSAVTWKTNRQIKGTQFNSDIVLKPGVLVI